MQQNLPELCIHLSICKIYVILLLTLILMNVQSGKGFRFLYEDHLVELLPADGAVFLLAQHPHLGGAAVTHRVIALPHREHVDVLAAQHTCALRVLLRGVFHTERRHWLCVLAFSRFNPCGIAGLVTRQLE